MRTIKRPHSGQTVECRLEAENLGLEGRMTMQAVIESYEWLIAMVEGLAKAKPG